MDILIGLGFVFALGVGAAIWAWRRRCAAPALLRPHPRRSYPSLSVGPVSLTYLPEGSGPPVRWPSERILELRSDCEAQLAELRTLRALLEQKGVPGLPTDEELSPRLPPLTASPARWEEFALWIERWHLHLSQFVQPSEPPANDVGRNGGDDGEEAYAVEVDVGDDSAPASSAGSRK